MDERSATMTQQLGPSFDSWLHEEGLYDDVTGAAITRVLSRQIADAMAEQHITKTERASRMRTSRAALDRLLDPVQESIPLRTLRKAAQSRRPTTLHGIGIAGALRIASGRERVGVRRTCRTGLTVAEARLVSLPTWNALRLRGARAGTWSLHVTRNGRRTFWMDAGAAVVCDIDVEDYH